MAENRVTAEFLEAGLVRNAVPGDARVSAELIEVALLQGVAPSGSARLTAEMLEVGIVRPTSGARAGDFFFAQ